ncbi:hypothetical protein FRB98_000362 [Tulasnella sp. 332]|nr:hypothetical protein FRB98_000362 [Tulasnella sp. 332]
MTQIARPRVSLAIVVLLFGTFFLVLHIFTEDPHLDKHSNSYQTDARAIRKGATATDGSLFHIPWHFPSNPFRTYITPKGANLTQRHPPRRHVAIATDFGPHFEVYMTVAWTMTKMLTGPTESVHLYINGLGENYGEIVERSGMYNLTAGGSQQGLKKPEALVGDVLSNTLFDDDGDIGAQIDMVVLGTMKRWSADLLKIWEARPAGQKFQLVCIVHNGGDRGWMSEYAIEWVARDALRLLPMSEHITSRFVRELRGLADWTAEPFYSSLFEYVKVDVHYCIAPLPPLPSSKHMFPGKNGLANAAILGNLQQGRRNYDGTFEDLTKSLTEDAPAWGYLPKLSAGGSFEPDSSSGLTPFKLHLIGGGSHPIPEVLKNVVTHHKSLPYPEYYALVQSMDVILPAFAEGGGGYFESQGSSAIHAFVMSNVPMLATRRLRDAYRYVDDDRIVIPRPMAVTEMQAILALRTNSAKNIPNPHNSTRLARDLDQMISLGWRRPMSNFMEVKTRLWDKNEEVVWRLMRDL